MSIYNSNFKIEKIFSALKDRKKEVRFIGVLGSGMYPLARLLIDFGYKVSGYDRSAIHWRRNNLSENTTKERNCLDLDYKNDIRLCEHTEVDWKSVGLAVYSLAIEESDPEILAARSHGVLLISRAQLLGALMSEAKVRISVSGSHGKSTTTAIIDRILTAAEMQPTSVSGATLSSGIPYRKGSGEVFLAEACEYKDSFLSLSPTHQIITSVELDHTDYFHSKDQIRRSFLIAAERAETVIINRDDRLASDIALELKRGGAKRDRLITYGESEGADYRFRIDGRDGEMTRFSVISKERIFDLETALIGKYNLSNITAAIALCDNLGIDPETVKEAVGSFHSVDRRMTLLSRINGVPVYYDYAHHPTEIKAAITALKERYGSVTVIFRPHTFSRTFSLWQDFIAALSKADFTILLDIYPAREEPIDGVNSEKLAKAIPSAVFASMADAPRLALASPRGAIALLGAGEVDGVRDELIRLGDNNNENKERVKSDRT